MNIEDYGIISYAGLSKDVLFSDAGTLFGQTEIPGRYRALLTVFPAEMIQNMEYIGKATPEHRFVTPAGFSMDPAEYHAKMYLEHPSLYTADNFSRNFDYEGHFQGDSVFTVDDAWAEMFPQYRPFMGEKLVIHMIGNGCQAVAVPDSIKLRSGYLDVMEEQLEITAQAQSFIRYAIAFIRTGKPYDADAFAADYLRSKNRAAVSVRQRELEKLLQRSVMLSGKRGRDGQETFFLHSARQAVQIQQYMPMRYACDLFSEQAVTPAYARLAQPYYEGMDFVGDLWIPYQEILPYVNKVNRELDMRKLCESYQIAPVYDPTAPGGKYPDRIRIAVVRDRDMTLMTADALNNPAYGSGMNVDGTMGKHVFIKNSLEMIHTRRLDIEKLTFRCINLHLPAEEYLSQQKQARLQETKGRLIDALYRLEMAKAGGGAEKALLQKLEKRAERLRAAVHVGVGTMSGYDSDISYLERKQRDPSLYDEPLEASVECGYAMRNAYCRVQDAALEEEQDEPELPAEEEPALQRAKGDPPMKLTPKDIAKMLDHSTLQPYLTQDDIRSGCEIALKYGTASVCARPADMPLVKELLAGSDVHVCTVIGFPHGNHKSEIKFAEAETALNDGCEELDMVINIGRLIGGDDQYVQDEIANICALAHSRGAKVKVIIETCYLSNEQKVRACKLAAAAGADWVKTSTGYGSGGCKLEDVILMRKSVPADCQVKGSGGIRDLDTVLALRVAGATRCGVSATEKIMAEAEVRYANGTLEEPTLDDLTFEESGDY
ncbi:MAG TPA: deoxyribose-phosphate aldolase [Candidatus Limiplasma sp.]|nr:deoxyribose-phosphate aldolase [Candidatus Limiplasma sp.]